MSQLKVTPLHPTFAAELSGVDFTKPVPPETYDEIRKIVDKVCLTLRPDMLQAYTTSLTMFLSMASWSVETLN